MTEATVRHTDAMDAGRAAQPAPGNVWFGAMVAVWSIFLTLLVVSPGTLDDVYEWLRGLWVVWEVLMWIVLLPWALAHVVLESSWPDWLRIVVVVLLATFHLAISQPRAAMS